MPIPLQAYCNPDDPEEHALWALIGIEQTPGVPLIVPEAALRGLSRQLVEYAGFRHHPELQTRKAVITGMPEAESVHWMGTGMLSWVPLDFDPGETMRAVEPNPVTVTSQDLDKMSGADLIALADDLRRRGVIGDPPPDEPDEVTVGRLGDQP